MRIPLSGCEMPNVCVMLYVKSIFHYFTFRVCVCMNWRSSDRSIWCLPGTPQCRGNFRSSRKVSLTVTDEGMEFFDMEYQAGRCVLTLLECNNVLISSFICNNFLSLRKETFLIYIVNRKNGNGMCYLVVHTYIAAILLLRYLIFKLTNFVQRNHSPNIAILFTHFCVYHLMPIFLFQMELSKKRSKICSNNFI